MAMNKERFVNLLKNGDFQMITNFRQIYIDSLKQYYFIGGMPEAVVRFSENQDFNEVRELQKRILDAYEQDFSKHAPNEIVPKIRMVWNSIPSQLAKDNKKFIYGLVRERARAKDYETAIMWLTDCRLIHKTGKVNTPGLPLKAYEDLKAFKLFTHLPWPPVLPLFLRLPARFSLVDSLSLTASYCYLNRKGLRELLSRREFDGHAELSLHRS